jgi:catechol 2,3-dioxygenase-like lactoylglutathione lyase family enzyme
MGSQTWASTPCASPVEGLQLKPLATHGLTHVALAVRDPRRSLAFYRALLGVEAVYEDADSIQAQTPGTRDVLVFEKDARHAGRRGGVVHFGFRLVEPVTAAEIAAKVTAAGGRILDQGEFAPGLPYVFCEDPDGYEVEIWFEAPTPLDPGA